jgi:hypothetical protein
MHNRKYQYVLETIKITTIYYQTKGLSKNNC